MLAIKIQYRNPFLYTIMKSFLDNFFFYFCGMASIAVNEIVKNCKKKLLRQNISKKFHSKKIDESTRSKHYNNLVGLQFILSFGILV